MDKKNLKIVMPILQAIVEGKTIQHRTINKEWLDTCVGSLDHIVTYYKDYRIKPEPTYRPFANAEECWQEMQEHQPFGWLKTIGVRTHFAECKSIGELVMIGLENTPHIYEHAFHTYTFADGTPFGVKVEE